ncbi:MAG TPA: SIMPL domain-containing protein [Caulobacteraceae bacterium]|jgi:hypothetical protein
MGGKDARLVAAIMGGLVAVGLLGAGYFVSNTLYKGKLASNTVTVRGFAERDVRADLALWQISYSVTGGNLPEIYGRSRVDETMVLDFLARNGFRKQDIVSGNLEVSDLMANQYRSKETTDSNRYIVKDTISVRSADVDLVNRSNGELNDLARQGIVLTANTVDFEFTKLNDIKAPMLRAATENARDAAQQFATDAGSKVGSIQNASQGFFSIVSRAGASTANPDNQGDNGQQGSGPNTIDKRARVVVTLTYYLVR